MYKILLRGINNSWVLYGEGYETLTDVSKEAATLLSEGIEKDGLKIVQEYDYNILVDVRLI